MSQDGEDAAAFDRGFMREHRRLISLQDIKDQIGPTLAEYGSHFDVDGLADEIVRRYGRVDIDSIPAEDYWALVASYDRDKSGEAGR